MRVRRLRGSYFMKGLWCDTDRGRRRKKCWNVLHIGKTGHGEGCGATEGRAVRSDDERAGAVGGRASEGWEERRGRFYLMTGRSDLL